MDEPESFLETASDEELDRAVTFLVELFGTPLRLANDPQAIEKVFAVMIRAATEPEKLKNELMAEARKSSPEKLREDLAFLVELMRAPRRTVMDIVAPALPPGIPGKKPKVTLSVEKQIVRAAKSLWPVAQALIELRGRTSKRSLEESVRYLEIDYPEGARMLAKHLDAIDKCFAHEQLKRPQTKARRLACMVISREFEISDSYAEKWAGAYLKSKRSTN